MSICKGFIVPLSDLDSTCGVNHDEDTAGRVSDKWRHFLRKLSNEHRLPIDMEPLENSDYEEFNLDRDSEYTRIILYTPIPHKYEHCIPHATEQDVISIAKKITQDPKYHMCVLLRG